MPYYNSSSGLSGTVGTTDNAVPRANGTNGNVIQASTVKIDDNGSIITPEGSSEIHQISASSWSGAAATMWSYTPDLGDGVYWIELRVALSRSDTGPTYRWSTWQAAFSVSSGTPTRISSTSGGEEEDSLSGTYAPASSLDVSGGNIVFTAGTAGASGKYAIFPTIIYISNGLT